MSVRYDDRDLAILLVSRGVLTFEAIEGALRAASDPSPGRLVTTLLQQRVLDTATLEQALSELCSHQFRCRACQIRFVALPLEQERKVACPQCAKWNLIPPATPPSAAAARAQSGPARTRPRTDDFRGVPGFEPPRKPSTRDEVAPAAPASNDAPPQRPRRPTGTVVARPSAVGPRPAEQPSLDLTRALDQEATEPLARHEAPGAALPASNSSRVKVPVLTAPLVPGQLFGPYTIVGELARGAMGVLYTARHEKVKNRIVALKVLQGDLAQDKEQVERFKREAQALARVNHPSVVRVHDAGQIDGQPFFTMELVEGQNLEDRIRPAPLGPVNAARLLAEVARGCAYLHTRGVIHRDLKLSNVLVGADGRPRIADFGLARLLDRKTRLTLEGDMLGTPLYMAPEQIRGELDVNPRTDVYALGVMLFRLVTKAYPFSAPAPTALYAKVLTEPPAWPGDRAVPEPLRLVVERCLRKEREDRYPDATTLALDLDAFVRGAEVTAPRPSITQIAREALSLRRSAPVLTGLMIFAVSLLGLAFVVAGVRFALRLDRRAKLKDATAVLVAERGSLHRVSQAALSGGGELDVKRIRDALARPVAPLGALDPRSVAGRPLDEVEASLLHASVALEGERSLAGARIARLLADLALATPSSAERLSDARHALSKVTLSVESPLDEGASGSGWGEERALLEDARVRVLLLVGAVSEARAAAERAFDSDAKPELKVARAVGCARLALLDDDAVAAATSWLAWSNGKTGEAPRSGPRLGPLGADLTRSALARLGEIARATEVEPGALDPIAGVTLPVDGVENDLEQRVLARVAAVERARPALERPDADDSPLAAARSDLRRAVLGKAPFELATLAGVAVGELELLARRPASAAEAFELAALGGRKRLADLGPAEHVALARNPAIVELVPGLRATLPMRAAIALGLARARGQMLDDDAALASAQAAVAAVESGSAAGCAAQLLLAAAYRTSARNPAALHSAHEAEERAEAALEGCRRGPEASRLLRAAIVASRARTRLMEAFGEKGFRETEEKAAAQTLLSGPVEALADGQRLAAAFERLRLRSAAPKADPDPVLEDLVARSRAELAAGLAVTDLLEIERETYAERQRAHGKRALRAARLAREQDPSSEAAYAALARAWLANGLPASEALDYATHALLLSPAPSPEALAARALCRLAMHDPDAAAAAAQDWKDAEKGAAARTSAELAQDDELYRLHRLAASSLEAAGARALALAERVELAQLGHERSFDPVTLARLEKDVQRAAARLGDTTLAEASGKAVAAALDRVAPIDRAIAAADAARQKLWTEYGPKGDGARLDPASSEALLAAVQTSRTDARLFLYLEFVLGKNPNGTSFPAFSADSIAAELNPELGQHALMESVGGAGFGNATAFERYADPASMSPDKTNMDKTEDARLPLRCDPDVRGAMASAVALSMDLRETDGRSLGFARRLVRRRPELRTAHHVFGRILTFLGDGKGAIEELQLAEDLPNLLEDAPAPLDEHPGITHLMAGLAVFLAEANVARGWSPAEPLTAESFTPCELTEEMREGVRRALVLAEKHHYQSPARVGIWARRVFQKKELDEIVGRIARASTFEESKK